MDLIDALSDLANYGKCIIVACLDQDYMGKPFEPVPQLLSTLSTLQKLMLYASNVEAWLVIPSEPSNPMNV